VIDVPSAGGMALSMLPAAVTFMIIKP